MQVTKRSQIKVGIEATKTRVPDLTLPSAEVIAERLLRIGSACSPITPIFRYNSHYYLENYPYNREFKQTPCQPQ